jgi:hypothetical protein
MQKIQITHTSVRIRRDVLDKLREHTIESRHTLAGFTELAILEKIERERREKKEYVDFGKPTQ